MSTDSSIRDQTYAYFLIEAPELLQSIEDHLFTLRDAQTANTVHHLMRMTHTLKGAAASVGLKTVKEIAHALEDIFKALYNPEIKLDDELESLLFQGYEALRKTLAAELAGCPLDEEMVLKSAQLIFEQLQAKLGSNFDESAALPSSVDLGFDLTESIFETGVQDRLTALDQALTTANPEIVGQALREQAQVFLGLAESLSLPGFGAIAQIALTALNHYPHQTLDIATVAIQDWKAARASVLGGDRSQGGSPSAALQHWLHKASFSTQPLDCGSEPTSDGMTAAIALEDGTTTLSDHTELSLADLFLTPTETADAEISLSDLFASASLEPDALTPALQLPDSMESLSLTSDSSALASLFTLPVDPEQSPIDDYTASIECSEPDSHPEIIDLTPVDLGVDDPVLPADLSLVQNEAEHLAPMISDPGLPPDEAIAWTEVVGLDSEVNLSLEDLVGQAQYGEASMVPNSHEEAPQYPIPPAIALEPALHPLTPFDQSSHQVVELELSVTEASIPSARNHSPQANSIRVETQKLKRLDYLTGEMLTQHNQQMVTDQQLDEIATRLQSQVLEHRQLLQQIRDWADQLLIQPQFLRPSLPGEVTASQAVTEVSLDSIELDPYSELHVLLQSALEETMALEESAEAVRLFYQQSNQSLDKQKKLLSEVRENLANAQMIPVSTLFTRFVPMVRQLASSYNKPAELHLSGLQVLMDRFLVEKLHDPILHLLRNGFDHGLEPVSDRQAMGKPEVGQLSLHAYRRDRWFVIMIKDDGKGIDYDQVLSRAIAKKLLKPEDADNLTESKLLGCLFEPGFSTASQLSDLSGRGVGLDVVKTQIEALRGRITIQSTPYQGTTFSLYLPCELNVAKVIICRSQSQHYAFLSESIAQIVVPQAEQIQGQGPQRQLRWPASAQEQLLPIHPLSELLSYTLPLPGTGLCAQVEKSSDAEKIAGQPLLLMYQSNQGIALEVDEILGEQELVIRPISTLVPVPSFLIGCCVLSSGHLTLLLDGAAFIAQSQTSSPTEAILPARLPLQDPAAQSGAMTVSGSTILVVDDSVTLRQNLALTLQKAGYSVFQARDGQDALDQLQQHPQIDMVICDVEMPRMNGFEFLSRRSQDTRLAAVPVVMLTSRSGDKHRKIASELGANGYLTKPYFDQELLDKVTGFLPLPDRVASQNRLSTESQLSSSPNFML